MIISIGTQEKINEFIEENKDKYPKTIENMIIETLLEDMMAGDCRITASKTDHKQGKMWVEFTWGEDE